MFAEFISSGISIEVDPSRNCRVGYQPVPPGYCHNGYFPHSPGDCAAGKAPVGTP
jgi:hypothetical protein